MYIKISGSGTKHLSHSVLCSYNHKLLSPATIFWLITGRVLFQVKKMA